MKSVDALPFISVVTAVFINSIAVVINCIFNLKWSIIPLLTWFSYNGHCIDLSTPWFTTVKFYSLLIITVFSFIVIKLRLMFPFCEVIHNSCTYNVLFPWNLIKANNWLLINTCSISKDHSRRDRQYNFEAV